MGRMEVGAKMNFLLATLVGFVSGVIGAMGMGGGGVLIIYLTIFAGVSQLAAQGTNLIFFLPVAVLAVIIYSKRGIIKWKTIAPIMFFGVLGTLVSGWAVGLFDGAMVRRLFGLLVIIYGFFELLQCNKKENPKKG